MTQPPRISGRDTVRALGKIGYMFDRERGSHIVLRQVTSPFRRVVVPDHKEVAKGTLWGIIKQVGLTIEEFIELL